MRYLIVGGGIAGTTAAEELRKIDPNGSIVLISEEQNRLYSRVLLPHYINGKVERERCFLKKESWYEQQKIEAHFGVTVSKLDVKNHFVATSDGREHEYDKLLIATGGEVKTHDEDCRGISYLRTLDDADHLLQLLGESPSSVGIVGAGFIAIEYINIFADRGLKAELFTRTGRFFSRSLDQDSSDLIKERVERDGIVVSNNPPRLQEYAIVGIGMGVAPDLSWIKEAGVETRAGILANDFLETNVPNVYTAGDVAEYFDLFAKRHLIVGNWMNAMTQGRIVAKTMAGERTRFELVSSYATNVRGMEIIFVGDTDREKAERIIRRGSKGEGGITQLFVRAGRVVGATLVNRNSERAEVTKLIREKIDL
ncbi:MAG: FAD-dependent oxidoreductase [Patescibacteria group bacterium]